MIRFTSTLREVTCAPAGLALVGVIPFYLLDRLAVRHL